MKNIFTENSRAYYDEFIYLVEIMCKEGHRFTERKNFEKSEEVLREVYKVIERQKFVIKEAKVLVRNYQAYLYKDMALLDKAIAYLGKADNMLSRGAKIPHGLTYLNYSNLMSIKKL